jgi:hypothetical protein
MRRGKGTNGPKPRLHSHFAEAITAITSATITAITAAIANQPMQRVA